MMLERQIYQILDAGRAHINADPSFIIQYFCDQGLTRREAEGIRDYWLGRNFHRRSLDNENFEDVGGVNIVHQYPRTNNQPQFPCWAIVLEAEREGEDKHRFLGDEVDDIVLDAPEGLTSFSGSIEKKMYAVYTYADNPDVCIYYHELLTFFMKRARDVLKDTAGAGVLDTAFSGNDMGPDPRYGPEFMFIRRFGIELSVLETVQKSPQEERGSRVGGVWVRNPDGLDITTSADGETIVPNVTPIGADDD